MSKKKASDAATAERLQRAGIEVTYVSPQQWLQSERCEIDIPTGVRGSGWYWHVAGERGIPDELWNGPFSSKNWASWEADQKVKDWVS